LLRLYLDHSARWLAGRDHRTSDRQSHALDALEFLVPIEIDLHEVHAGRIDGQVSGSAGTRRRTVEILTRARGVGAFSKNRETHRAGRVRAGEKDREPEAARRDVRVDPLASSGLQRGVQSYEDPLGLVLVDGTSTGRQRELWLYSIRITEETDLIAVLDLVRQAYEAQGD
jgi:hypothetical protein